jgi:hypothetical protein
MSETPSTLLPYAHHLWTAGLTPLPRVIGHAGPAHITPTGEIATIAWGDYKRQQPDWATVHGWFARGNLTTVGMLLLTGTPVLPGARDDAVLQILDFETAAIFAEFQEAMHFAGHSDVLHRCVRERTPSGGVHLGFRCQAISEKQTLKLAQRAKDPADPTAKTLLIELLQHQTCTVAPTAIHCKPEHPVGVAYRLEHGDWAHPLKLSANQRRVLIEMASSFNEVPEKIIGRHAISPGDGSRPGDLLNAQADLDWWRELLTRHGWRDVSRWGLRSQGVSYFQRPGKTGYQLSAAYGKTGQCLYVFSGNAQPFEPDTAYTPFAALALLKHDGDFAACAKALAPSPPPDRLARDRWRYERRQAANIARYRAQINADPYFGAPERRGTGITPAILILEKESRHA